MTFEGIRPVLHLPFDGSHEQRIVDAEFTALADRMIDAGVDGLVVLGLASEAWSVTESERDHVVGIAVAACAGRVPLVVGIDGTTRVAVERGRRARSLGAAGLMVLPPRQAVGRSALVAHFSAVADAGGLPVLVQDSP
jgi:4-hydroxy-tetrahydrodipicolinate synthase